MRLISVTTLLALMSVFTLGQEYKPLQAPMSVAPPEKILLLVASQPDCPLLIEEPKLLLDFNDEKQRPRFEYSVRSVSRKPIRSYTVAAWWSNQTGGTLKDGKERGLVREGEIIRTHTAGYRLVPLREDLKAKLGHRMQALVVLMTYQIRFEDGSEYNGEPLSRSMLQFFEDSFR